MARVLVVDDEKSIRLTSKAFLEGAGHEVSVAGDEEEAAACLKGAVFDVVVSDIILPQGSGLGVLRRVRETCQGTQVVLMTGEPSLSSVSAALRGRAFDYLTKPVTKETLLEVVRQAAELKAREDQISQMADENFAYRCEIEALSTKRKTALLQTETQLRTLIDTIPDLVWLKDPDGVYLACNRSFGRVFGATEAEIVGKTDYDFVDRELADFFRENDRAAVAAGATVMSEEEVTFAADGHRALLETLKTPMYDKEGTLVGVLGIGRDIIEKREREGQLRHSQKLESIGTLAGGVAHEINNPINGIMNYSQLIMDRMEGKDETLVDYAGEIIHETERVATIVRNLLAFARQEEQQRGPARLCDMVDATLSLLRAVIRQDQITLEVDVPEDLPPITCHSQQLQQVIMNLLANARDALNEKYTTFSDEKRITISAHLFDKNGAAWIRTTIADKGPGIPAAVQDRMFDPFYTTKARDKGTGLGLSISHGIVGEHHGELSVESELGSYTRFHIDLPID